jgi:ribose-phosphate pyrophosphokinase
LSKWRGRAPVLVDDLASSGRTMAEAARQLQLQGCGKPYCVVVHALFADDASYAQLRGFAADVISSDTVLHPSNAITVASSLADRRS